MAEPPLNSDPAYSVHVPLSKVAQELGLAGEKAAQQLMRDKHINIYKKPELGWCINKGDYSRVMQEHTHERNRKVFVERQKEGDQGLSGRQ